MVPFCLALSRYLPLVSPPTSPYVTHHSPAIAPYAKSPSVPLGRYSTSMNIWSKVGDCWRQVAKQFPPTTPHGIVVNVSGVAPGGNAAKKSILE